MDGASFDRLARIFGSTGTRRAALGALLGTGVAGTLGAAGAAKKDRTRKRKGGKKGKTAQVSAQAADCLSPGASSNMNGCTYAGEDFSGDDLSGSSMVGTNFNNAELVGTKLHSSNMKNASFRGADLECADLSSSVLRNADFRGFDPLTGGRPTNLTGADLSSSGGCGTILTNQFTIICGTTWCDGSVRNDDCPGGPPAGSCCDADDCAEGEACDGGRCVGCRSDADCGPCNACVGDRCQAVPSNAVDCHGAPLQRAGEPLCTTAPHTGICVDGACWCGQGVYNPDDNRCVCPAIEAAGCARNPGQLQCCEITRVCVGRGGGLTSCVVCP